MSTVDVINAVANGIGSLGGLLGPMIGRHSQATSQIGQLLTEVNAAAASGDWEEVKTIANQILAVPGASQAVMEDARNISKAASNAIGATTAMGVGVPAAQAAALTMTSQQLVMTEVAALNSQLNAENSGIWNHLWHLHRITSTGVTG